MLLTRDIHLSEKNKPKQNTGLESMGRKRFFKQIDPIEKQE
jgi:hypothetical protein